MYLGKPDNNRTMAPTPATDDDDTAMPRKKVMAVDGAGDDWRPHAANEISIRPSEATEDPHPTWPWREIRRNNWRRRVETRTPNRGNPNNRHQKHHTYQR